MEVVQYSALAFVAEWSKALDSSSSPSCGRGFESHRKHHFAPGASGDGAKNAFDRGRTGDLGIMRPTRCQLRHESRMRHPGIEPGALRWQRSILPLNQWRFWLFDIPQKE